MINRAIKTLFLKFTNIINGCKRADIVELTSITIKDSEWDKLIKLSQLKWYTLSFYVQQNRKDRLKEVVMTIYEGLGGEIAYTVDGDLVYAGKSKDIAFKIFGDTIYEGLGGSIAYKIDSAPILYSGNLSYDESLNSSTIGDDNGRRVNSLYDDEPLNVSSVWDDDGPLDVNSVWGDNKPLDVNSVWGDDEPLDINNIWDDD